MMPISEVTNEDCMVMMGRYPDKFFDLAIVDPPYGIKESSYRATPSKCAADKKKYNTTLWKQEKPNKAYFDELFRISNNQIVWGGNYFTDNLYESRCWIIWDKCTQDSLFADVEMAWTSFDKSSRLFTFRWNGMLQGNMKNKQERIHPTEKPFQLYQWLLKEFLKDGNSIIDTHLGSGSHRVAAWRLGIDFYAAEIDTGYYESQDKRFKEAINDPLFKTIPEPVQNKLFDL